MPIVSGGGGGGSLAPPVVLAGTDPNTTPLTIKGAAAQTDSLLEILQSDDTGMLVMGPTGDVDLRVRGATVARLFRLSASDGTRALTVNGDGAGAVDSTIVSASQSAGAVKAEAFQVFLGDDFTDEVRLKGRVNQATRATAAPADGDIFTSAFALWLDTTPAATKLMVKAKDSAGTVKTATILLA